MKLNTISNIAVIIAVLVFIGTTLNDRFFVKKSIPAPQGLLLGKMLALNAAVAVGSEATVALFVVPKCRFCTESMPFYSRLTSFRGRDLTTMKVVAIAPFRAEKAIEVKSYLAGHGVMVDAADEMPYEKLGVRGTPTLMILDGSRRGLALWTGLLSTEQDNEAVRKIKSLCS